MKRAPLVLLGMIIFLGGCSGPRYILVSENVAASSAGGQGDYRPTSETIRARTIRLDTRTGEMVLVADQFDTDASGEHGALSLRVFTPEETNRIIRARREQGRSR
jgi:hypothetical protein